MVEGVDEGAAAKFVNPTERCGLCHRSSVLRDSHILPEWGYNSLYDEKHRLLVLRSGGAFQPAAEYLQKGIRERLLCQHCETRLSRHERYARDLLTTPGRLALPPHRQGRRNRADYKPFKLFQLSLLCRAHLSTHPLFAAVDLGRHHSERIRMMLDTEDPGKGGDYPCVVGVLYLEGEPRASVMFQAASARTEGQRTYRLVFAGFYWMYVVSSHTDRHTILPNALQADGTFILRGVEALKSDGLRQYMADLMSPNRANVERLQAGRTRRRS